MLNVFAGAAFDRAAALRRDPTWIADRLADPRTRFAPVWQLKNLFEVDGGPRVRWLGAAEARPLLGAGTAVFLGMMHGAAHFAVEVGHEDPADVVEALAAPAAFDELRRHGSALEPAEAGMLAFARGMMHWHARTRFCGVCGEPTEPREAGHVRACTAPACGATHFPRTDPAVIVVVTHGERALLGRQPAWDRGRYSSLAGFVEPGEGLEDAVAREVWEEAGVRVREVRYHSSQPWPFPSSLMVGFTAVAESEEIRVDHDELEDARWFTRAEVRRGLADGTLLLPSPISISYRLVTEWLEG